MLGIREEPFMTEALDSRATSRESSALAEGDWRCCISLVRDVLLVQWNRLVGPGIPTH